MDWIEYVRTEQFEFRMRKSFVVGKLYVEYRSLFTDWTFFGVFNNVFDMRNAQENAK